MAAICQRCLHLADQHHDAGNGAGAGEHGDAHGHDAGVVLGGGGLAFRRGSPASAERLASSMSRPMSSRMTPPAISNAGSVMPNMRKMYWPAKAKAVRTTNAVSDALRAVRRRAGFVLTCGDGEEGGQRGEGVDQEEDGAEREQRKTHVGGALQCVSARLGAGRTCLLDCFMRDTVQRRRDRESSLKIAVCESHGMRVLACRQCDLPQTYNWPQSEGDTSWHCKRRPTSGTTAN